MIRTLAPGADPSEELRRRLKFLQDVELPLLRSQWGDDGHLGTEALRHYAEREVEDAVSLLEAVSSPLRDLAAGECARLNDCVTLRYGGDGEAEEFVVHAPGLVVRAPGYLAADTALGAAVLGRRSGDAVDVLTPGGSVTYLLTRIRRSS